MDINQSRWKVHIQRAGNLWHLGEGSTTGCTLGELGHFACPWVPTLSCMTLSDQTWQCCKQMAVGQFLKICSTLIWHEE